MHPVQSTKACLLKFADYHQPILRTVTEAVQFPLSVEDKQIIENMKYSIQKEQLKEANAEWDDAAGMAANQWGINKRIFLFCPEGASNNDLEVIINPTYQPLPGTESDDTWEGCFSVPLATGRVKRYKNIRVTYQDESGKTIEKELSNWPARVWQHETDHLNGLLYDDVNAGKCIELKKFSSKEDLEAFYDALKKETEKNIHLQKE